VSLEILALGLISGLRPATSQAGVVALLKAPEPRRTLLFFTVAGFTASVVIGALVLLLFHGARVTVGASTFAALFDLLAGVAALILAALYRRGSVTLRRSHPRAVSSTGATARFGRRLRNPSVWTAAAAGLATHLPGLVYFVALNAIAAEQHGVLTAVAQLAIYNALWFALPLAALSLAILRPGSAPVYLERATEWGRRHERRLVFAVLVALGGYLVTRGAIHLL
jgi:Sap-like sulfolipid-1-addressing protein